MIAPGPLSLGMLLNLAATAGLACAEAAAAPHVATTGLPKVHIAEGMWSQLWKLPEALGSSYAITESFLCSRYGFSTWLKGFPDKLDGLLANQVVILANVPADSMANKALGRSDAWIEEFLARGGGVLVLGGNYALGTGGNLGGRSFGDLSGTAMQRFLPAEIHEADIDIGRQHAPVPLRPTMKHQVLDHIDWTPAPVTLFFHEVVPKAGAQVVIAAGEAPVLILGTYKSGRIALWTATLHGEPPAGSLAYWRWKEWPALMSAVTKWLAGK